MYTIMWLVLLAVAAYYFVTGRMKRKTGRAVAGAVTGVLTLLLFQFMSFWGEKLWFDATGYTQRFWTEIAARAGFFAAGAFYGWLVLFVLTAFLPKQKKYIRLFGRSTGALIGAVAGISNWDVFLRYINRVSVDLAEPVLGRDAGFYMFVLPFYDRIYGVSVFLAIVGLAAALFAVFVRVRDQELNVVNPENDNQVVKHSFRALFLNSAVLLFLLAVGKYLARFHLLYSKWGAVSGPGWTDVNVRLPAYDLSVVITVGLGVVLLVPAWRRPLGRILSKNSAAAKNRALPVFSAVVLMLLSWFLILTVVPGLFQWLRVEPNEITFEKPYIKNNIKFTRHAFKLHTVEEREFPAAEQFSRSMVAQNKNLFDNIRLWDYRALDAVYKQFQEIRLYYEFVDVDIDRYMINDAYRQVMVSAREMEPSNLPVQSQTFVNKRFKYTHGYGITLTAVSDFTPEGLPNLLIKDIPPRAEYPGLTVDRPEIYYGELTDTHVIVNSGEKEFDYPSGEKNIYVNYNGSGGVQISNIWRKFIYGWKFDGTRFFVSNYPNRESRLMFHRRIQERVRSLAPFLEFDDDPYIVLADGKLYWIIDAYTTSDYFPYSEPFVSNEYMRYKQNTRNRMLKTKVEYGLNNVNYIRNSVKIVVDAYNGNVDYYIFDNGPVIRVWSKIFPGLFKTKEDMPAEIRAHVRYPVDMLLVQGLVYAKYHMNDPTVFYNQEDLWIRATEKYYGNVQPVEPYYIMWELPDSDEHEYTLILPFTPKNRQVLIGWIAGMCDDENYGRFLAYKFPKEQRILGPQQVETKIDQDSYLSGQLSLWDQRGSNVIRGNVLAIPIDETLLYVEPIYLRAETAAYPELRLVAVMHGDNLSYAETFDQALEGIFSESPGPRVAGGQPGAAELSPDQLIKDANNAFENYLRFTHEKKYRQAADALKTLEMSLNKLAGRREQQ